MSTKGKLYFRSSLSPTIQFCLRKLKNPRVLYISPQWTRDTRQQTVCDKTIYSRTEKRSSVYRVRRMKRGLNLVAALQRQATDRKSNLAPLLCRRHSSNTAAHDDNKVPYTNATQLFFFFYIFSTGHFTICNEYF
jgi:hypothetical protein